MKENTQLFLEKAQRAIRAAQTLLAVGSLPDFATGRAYYAMFYVAEGLLYEKGLRYRKHGALHASFGEHFAKGALLDPKFHRWMIDAFDKRIQGDYGVEAVVTSEDVVSMIGQAYEFFRKPRGIWVASRVNQRGGI